MMSWWKWEEISWKEPSFPRISPRKIPSPANGKDFVEAYKAEHDGAEPGSFECLGYDAIRMMAEAMRSLGEEKWNSMDLAERRTALRGCYQGHEIQLHHHAHFVSRSGSRGISPGSQQTRGLPGRSGWQAGLHGSAHAGRYVDRIWKNLFSSHTSGKGRKFPALSPFPWTINLALFGSDAHCCR